MRLGDAQKCSTFASMPMQMVSSGPPCCAKQVGDQFAYDSWSEFRTSVQTSVSLVDEEEEWQNGRNITLRVLYNIGLSRNGSWIRKQNKKHGQPARASERQKDRSRYTKNDIVSKFNASFQPILYLNQSCNMHHSALPLHLFPLHNGSEGLSVHSLPCTFFIS